MQTCSTSLQGLGAGPYRKAEVPPPTIGFLGETSATAARARHVVGTGAAVASTPTETLIVVGTPNLSSQGAGFTNSWGSSLKLMRSKPLVDLVLKRHSIFTAQKEQGVPRLEPPPRAVCVCVLTTSSTTSNPLTYEQLELPVSLHSRRETHFPLTRARTLGRHVPSGVALLAVSQQQRRLQHGGRASPARGGLQRHHR